MNPELEEVRTALVKARLKVLSILNAAAITIGGSLLAFHEMYPNAVSDFTATLSPIQKIVALAAWSGLVQYIIYRTKKAV